MDVDIDYSPSSFSGTEHLSGPFGSGRTLHLDRMNFMTKKVEMSDEPDNTSIRTQIDENLKKVYQEALKEDLPDRFKDLLSKLKQSENGK